MGRGNGIELGSGVCSLHLALCTNVNELLLALLQYCVCSLDGGTIVGSMCSSFCHFIRTKLHSVCKCARLHSCSKPVAGLFCRWTAKQFIVWAPSPTYHSRYRHVLQKLLTVHLFRRFYYNQKFRTCTICRRRSQSHRLQQGLLKVP